MVAFLRQFLVVLLVLLQNAAPLVHAHTGGNISQHGFHLYEFETLHTATGNLSMTSVDHGADRMYCIVNVGSAITCQQCNNNTVTACYPPNNDQGFAIARDTELVNFSPPLIGLIPKPLPSHNGSRAPPI